MRVLPYLIALTFLAPPAFGQIFGGGGSGCPTSGCTFSGPVAIPGGTIDGTTIGGTTPAAGTFTTLLGSTSVIAGLSSQNQVALLPKSSGTSPQVAAQGTDTNIDLILVSKGTGVVRTGSGTGNIFRSSHLSNVPGGPLTWSGNSSETNSAIYSNVSESGTTGTGDSGIYYLAISGDTIDASTAAGTLSSGLEIAHNYGGTGMKGSRSSLNVVSTLTAASSSPNGNSYVAGQFTCKSGVNDNGSSGHYTSACFGFNATAGLTSSNATFWGGVVGGEIDYYAATGSSYQDMMGLQLVWTTNGTQQPDREAIGLSLNNQFAPSSTAGLQYAIDIGKSGGNFPVKTGGTIIYGEHAGGTGFTVANGIDWHLGTFTGNSWNDGHFQLTGAGELIGSKITDPNTAPGAGLMKLTMEAGTNAGTCKLVARAGTSATPVTVIDNVGAGC